MQTLPLRLLSDQRRDGTITFVDGSGTSVGGAWTPLAWALWIGATIVVGRLWRVVPMWRHRHDSPGR